MLIEKKSEILSMPMLFLLSLLGVPSVIARDLKWVEAGEWVNLLLVCIPPMVWLGIVLWKSKGDVFRSLLLVGLYYGILIGITHQILWASVYVSPPVLGGKLSELPRLENAILTRAFSFFSSLVTGIIVGFVLGVLGTVMIRFKGFK